MDVLSEANVAQDLSDIIEAYLLAQDRQMMKDCIPSHSIYKNVATAVDNLGCDCFVEGRIPQVLIGVVNQCYEVTFHGAQWSCGVLNSSKA